MVVPFFFTPKACFATARLRRVSQPPANPAVERGGRRPMQCRIQNSKFKIQNWADEKYNFIIFVNWKEPL
jgi:hypothetical protein